MEADVEACLATGTRSKVASDRQDCCTDARCAMAGSSNIEPVVVAGSDVPVAADKAAVAAVGEQVVGPYS